MQCQRARPAKPCDTPNERCSVELVDPANGELVIFDIESSDFFPAGQ